MKDYSGPSTLSKAFSIIKSALRTKQDALTGEAGQYVGFDADGNPTPVSAPGGMTPYEYAVAGGYTGTEEEFLELLKSGPYLPMAGGTVTGEIVGGPAFNIKYDSGGSIRPFSSMGMLQDGTWVRYKTVNFGLDDRKRLIFSRGFGGEFEMLTDDNGYVGETSILGSISTPELDTDAANKAYVDTAIQTALSGAAGAKIATGSYVGNGKVGSANPTLIECGFSPKFVVCCRQGQSFFMKIADTYSSTNDYAFYETFIWFEGQHTIRIASTTTSSAYMQVTAGATYLSFYNNSTGASSVMQMNAPNNTYYWLAIG